MQQRGNDPAPRPWAGPEPVPPRRPGKKGWIVIALAVFVAVGVVGNLAKKPTVVQNSAQTTASRTTGPAASLSPAPSPSSSSVAARPAAPVASSSAAAHTPTAVAVTATSAAAPKPVPTTSKPAAPSKSAAARPSQPAPPPVAKTSSAAPALCGAPAYTDGLTFCGGSFVTSPPADVCSLFSCIDNFYNGRGYLEQCKDHTVSMSGGISGACSHHGGELRPVYKR